jgi:hypothetical protein
MSHNDIGHAGRVKLKEALVPVRKESCGCRRIP